MRRATALAVPDRMWSWSVSIHFVVIRFSAAENSQKNYYKLYFGDSRSFKVIGC